MKLERRRGALDTADTVLAVVVGVLAVMAALWVISWVIGTVMFLIKLAVFGLIVAGVIALVSKVRRS
jgi:fatty acid desaturase